MYCMGLKVQMMVTLTQPAQGVRQGKTPEQILQNLAW